MSRLVLLFGLPRSGTTWIGKILDSHPEVAYRHEPDSVSDMGLPLFPDAPWNADELDRARDFAERIPLFTHPRVVGKRPFFPKRFQPPGMQHILHAATLGAKAAGRLGLQIDRLPLAGYGTDRASRVVWKSIESLGRLGLLKAALPSATTVHILRHPCGYTASVLRGESMQRFRSSVPSWEDWNLFRMLLETDAGKRTGAEMKSLQRMPPWQRLAWRWRVINDKTLADLDGARDHRILLYEQLCRNPLDEAGQLLAHCGLSMEDQTRSFLQYSTRGDTRADYYSVVRDPWTSAWSWRRSLDGRQIREILEVVEGSRAWESYRSSGLDLPPEQILS